MALTVTKEDVWAAHIEDQPGGLAGVLETLSDAGTDLQCVIARRQPDKPGTGVVYLTPVKGRKQTNAAQGVGLKSAKNIPTLRVEGADKPGIGARMMRAIAEAGINVHGVSAVALGNKFAAYIGFDSTDDANKAAKVIKSLEQPARAAKRKPARAGAR
jgi:hypothetical protein